MQRFDPDRIGVALTTSLGILNPGLTNELFAAGLRAESRPLDEEFIRAQR